MPHGMRYASVSEEHLNTLKIPCLQPPADELISGLLILAAS